jgi:AcrR family transcriptional regulator
MPRNRSIRRKAGLNQASVVAAAAQLLNMAGPERLTLSRLAEHLGVQTPSLYNHIDGLPGLYRELALLNVRLLGSRLGDAVIGKSGPPALRALARAYRDYIKESPGLYLASLRPSISQAMPDPELQAAEERVVQIGLAVLASFGLRGEEGLHALRGLRSLVHGFATLELSGGFSLPLDCDESFRRLVEMFIRGLQQAPSED